MKRIILPALLALVIGLLLGKMVFGSKSNKVVKEEANTILKQIEEVNKLISVEGSFAEVYTLKETQKLFFDLIPVTKKAIIIANAKAYVAHDLQKMSYELDEAKKQVILKNIPEPEIIIEPDLKFYDLQDALLPFTEEELTKMNTRAVDILREKARTEGLIELAEQNLELNLSKILFVAEELGWEVIVIE
ncbi:MAG: DUF4230 domain-containing protein [Saprospiraceae bacterium]|nr:DUF4230 domain-containing protein [Saprospiraceae bacterium]